MLVVEALVSEGHDLTKVLDYTLPQTMTLHAAMSFRGKQQSIRNISELRLGVMMAKAKMEDFQKLIQEIENGD